MLINSRGIVLSALRYSDSSVIARVFTQEAGICSFMVRVGKGRTAIGKVSLLQPLCLVSVGFSDDGRKDLRTPRLFERAESLNNIPFDTVRSSIAIFMAEVMSCSLQEEVPDHQLFSFLYEAVLLLDREQKSCVNFHLKFLLEFSRFLGWYPDMQGQNLPYFDLREGEFCSHAPLHPDVLEGDAKQAFVALQDVGIADHAGVRMSNATRRILLQALLDYYHFHQNGTYKIRSHVVLEAVMA